MTWEPGFHGIVIGTGPYGWCIVDDEPAAGCSRAARSFDCVGDWECPVGATCEQLPEQLFGVCRPGARGTEIDLGC